jgi:hypothetical protein
MSLLLRRTVMNNGLGVSAPIGVELRHVSRRLEISVCCVEHDRRAPEHRVDCVPRRVRFARNRLGISEVKRCWNTGSLNSPAMLPA